jgi:hypothetical protein
METFKKIVDVVVMVYLVIALLIYLDILNVGQHTQPEFYTNFFLVGGAIMLLELVVENVYVLLLKRSQGRPYQRQINELKAQLYDQKQELETLRNQPRLQPDPASSGIRITPVTPAEDLAVKPVVAPQDTNVIINPQILDSPADRDPRGPRNPDSEFDYREPNR